MIHLTADHHFSHGNIIKFCHRPFSSAAEMDEVLIARWNEVVAPDDIVYHLGDFCMGGPAAASKYFRRLFGHIEIVPGGHDKRWLREKNYYTMGGVEKVNILPPLYVLKVSQAGSKHPLLITLCHYCMRSWPSSHYNSYHCFGHHHGRLPPIGKSMDVGVDTNDFYPYSLDEVLAVLDARPDNPGLVKRG